MRSLSIVLPLYNAEHLLPRVLPPLLDAVAWGDTLELIVVDDGSTDRGAEVARKLGAEVLSLPGPDGPGAARNKGVDRARGELVLFVDSDVIIHPDVPTRVRESFERHDGLVALFGSYDDRPDHRGLVSQYVNLRHHFVHQNGGDEATTFWAGCGAVERRAYLEVGGFDDERFSRPTIEDIDLGYRLRAAGGRIRFDNGMLGTHLKHWTLRGMIRTDVFARAMPWTRLLLMGRGGEKNLNVSPAERGKAMLSGAMTASLVAGVIYPPAFVLSALLLIIAFLVNRGLFLLILRRNGVAHMTAGVLLHQLYYHYSVFSFVYCLIEARVSPARTRT